MAQRSVLGTILNKSASIPRISATFSTAATYVAGLVYEFGAADWRQATTGAQEGRILYWLETGFTVAAGETKKVTVYALQGLQVIGKADGVIAPDALVKPSTNLAGSLETHTLDITTVTTLRDTLLDVVGKYLGKEDEIREGTVVRSSTADLDTDGVYLLGGHAV